jgi:hypothetical protein
MILSENQSLEPKIENGAVLKHGIGTIRGGYSNCPQRTLFI